VPYPTHAETVLRLINAIILGCLVRNCHART